MTQEVVAGQVMMSPVQMDMGDDIFAGKSKVIVKQEWAALECLGCEAKNRYRISEPIGGAEGSDVFLYINEESECCERICCGPNRSLKLQVRQGSTKDGPIVQTMSKPFHCQGCCFLRPKFDVSSPSIGGLGRVEDPFRCCLMDQQVYDKSDKLLFTTNGSICQAGICCPCCCSVDFDVLKNGAPVGKISKQPLDLLECCTKTNRFIIDFDKITDATEKRMLLAAAMLVDLEYFEQQKNDN